VTVDLHEVRFQCSGPILQQMIGRLQTSMTCADCHIGINIDTYGLANAGNEIQKAVEKVPPEITIKFFREGGLCSPPSEHCATTQLKSTVL
jgi:hypothetical protein